MSLGTHLQELGRDIALPIEACVRMLLSEGMKEEVGPRGQVRAGHLVLCHRSTYCSGCGCHPTIRAQVPVRPQPPEVKLALSDAREAAIVLLRP